MLHLQISITKDTNEQIRMDFSFTGATQRDITTELNRFNEAIKASGYSVSIGPVQGGTTAQNAATLRYVTDMISPAPKPSSS